MAGTVGRVALILKASGSDRLAPDFGKSSVLSKVHAPGQTATLCSPPEGARPRPESWGAVHGVACEVLHPFAGCRSGFGMTWHERFKWSPRLLPGSSPCCSRLKATSSAAAFLAPCRRRIPRESREPAVSRGVIAGELAPMAAPGPPSEMFHRDRMAKFFASLRPCGLRLQMQPVRESEESEHISVPASAKGEAASQRQSIPCQFPRFSFPSSLTPLRTLQDVAMYMPRHSACMRSCS